MQTLPSSQATPPHAGLAQTGGVGQVLPEVPEVPEVPELEDDALPEVPEVPEVPELEDDALPDVGTWGSHSPVAPQCSLA